MRRTTPLVGIAVAGLIAGPAGVLPAAAASAEAPATLPPSVAAPTLPVDEARSTLRLDERSALDNTVTGVTHSTDQPIGPRGAGIIAVLTLAGCLALVGARRRHSTT